LRRFKNEREASDISRLFPMPKTACLQRQIKAGAIAAFNERIRQGITGSEQKKAAAPAILLLQRCRFNHSFI